MVEKQILLDYLETSGAWEDSPILQIIFDNVKAKIENYCSRVFENDISTEDFYITHNSDRLYPKATPITKIKSIIINGDVEPVDNYKNMKSYIKFNKDLLEDYLVELKSFGGFEEVPQDVQRAFILQFSYEYARKDNIGANNLSRGGDTVSYPEISLLKDCKEILNPYKNMGRLF